MSEATIETTARLWVDPARVVHETLDGEVILIELERGNYYALRGGGAAVWSLALAGASTDGAAEALAAAHPEAGDAVAEDVGRLVAELHAEELLGWAPDEPPATVTSPPFGGIWETPVLQKFTDMQDFLRTDPIHDVDAAGWGHADAA
jgi:hypothetical protein